MFNLDDVAAYEGKGKYKTVIFFRSRGDLITFNMTTEEFIHATRGKADHLSGGYEYLSIKSSDFPPPSPITGPEVGD